MKMTARDRIIVLILLLATVIYGGYQMLWIPSSEKISALEKSKAEIQGLTADITPLLKQSETMRTETETLQKSIDDIKMAGGKTLTKEEFLLYLGKCATANGVKLLGFSDLGTEDSNGIYKAKFNFELQGSAGSINTILSDIDNMSVKYSVGSVSYRQMKDYDFLKRFFDSDTKLPWYKEPKKKDEQQEQQDEALLPPEETPLPSQPGFPEVFTSVPESAGDNMRLAVTICFLMFEKPDISNSFMAQQSEGI